MEKKDNTKKIIFIMLGIIIALLIIILIFLLNNKSDKTEPTNKRPNVTTSKKLKIDDFIGWYCEKTSFDECVRIHKKDNVILVTWYTSNMSIYYKGSEPNLFITNSQLKNTYYKENNDATFWGTWINKLTNKRIEFNKTKQDYEYIYTDLDGNTQKDTFEYLVISNNRFADHGKYYDKYILLKKSNREFKDGELKDNKLCFGNSSISLNTKSDELEVHDGAYISQKYYKVNIE